MATQILRDATIWMHEVAVHEIASSVSLDVGLETQDCTVFGAAGVAAAARKYAAGLFTGELTADGYADMTTFDGLLNTNFRARTDSVVSVSADSTDFSVGYFFEALHSELSPLGGTVGDMAAVSVTATTRGTYGPIRGNILLPSASRGGSSSGTARQLGAVSSTQRVFSSVHVTSGSGGTLTVKVQSDDAVGFPSSTDRITFAGATSPTAMFSSTAGAITDDWWRVNYTITGGTWTFVVFVGIA